jgi:hypothetical protein
MYVYTILCTGQLHDVIPCDDGSRLCRIGDPLQLTCIASVANMHGMEFHSGK